jgi:hypothetical protein
VGVYLDDAGLGVFGGILSEVGEDLDQHLRVCIERVVRPANVGDAYDPSLQLRPDDGRYLCNDIWQPCRLTHRVQ